MAGPTASSSSTARADSPLKRKSESPRKRKPRGGLIRAKDSGEVPGWTFDEEGDWDGGMFFIQMADTQVGMADSLFPIDPETGEPLFGSKQDALDAELEQTERAVAVINRLKPSFVVLCGDMTDEYPASVRPSASGEDSRPSSRGEQSASPKNTGRKSLSSVLQKAAASPERRTGSCVNIDPISSKSSTDTTSSSSGPMARFTRVSSPEPVPDASKAKKLKEKTASERRQKQLERCKAALSKISHDIPLLCCCGNHDAGNRPNFYSLKQYREAWGHDYFSFWVKGVWCLVINSQLYADWTDCEDEYNRQKVWLDAELKKFVGRKERKKTLSRTEGMTTSESSPSKKRKALKEDETLVCEEAPSEGKKDPKAMIVFSHISPFITSVDEPDAYFNWKQEERLPVLDAVHKAGCRGWFCGHYHRNSVGDYRGMPVVTTGAVGVNILTKNGGDPLGISGVGSGVLGDEISGLRLVRVDEAGQVSHTWKTMRQLASIQDQKEVEF